MMKIQQLKFFVAVYEEGSFSAGAVRVNATQSGLSMHVRQLEKRYGVTLLNRSSTGAEPTEAGRVFYKVALETLNASARAEETLKELSGAVSGHIDVGLMPTFTGSVLSATLLRFAKEYKHVRISIHEAYSANLSEQVAEGLLDFAVVPGESQDVGLDMLSMAKDRECLVCSSDNKILKDVKNGLKGLPPLRFVLPAKINARRPRIEQYLEMNGIKVSETMELDAMLGTLDLVANSEWVSILPSILGRADRDGKTRKFIPLTDPPLDVDYMRISHKARPLSRAAQAFFNTLQEELDSALEGSAVL